ncbi:MAG TPA: hypothetical protein VFX76_18335, partial [Roseiflexaceae bacterium]|nr:hypothetical protein [Roseiflexaceae bacterium]
MTLFEYLAYRCRMSPFFLWPILAIIVLLLSQTTRFLFSGAPFPELPIIVILLALMGVPVATIIGTRLLAAGAQVLDSIVAMPDQEFDT